MSSFYFCHQGAPSASQCDGGTTYSLSGDTIMGLCVGLVSVQCLGKIHPWEVCLTVYLGVEVVHLCSG